MMGLQSHAPRSNMQSELLARLDELMHYRVLPERVSITMPVMLPSGSNVSLDIALAPHARFLVTDSGLSYRECELLGGSHRNISKTLGEYAERFGVAFDGYSFWVRDVELNRVCAAATVVAQCCSLATTSVSDSISIGTSTEDNEQDFVATLQNIFGSGHVTVRPVVRGASTVDHKFAAKTTVNNKTAVFELVRPHQNSIANAALKFSDISHLDVPPKCVAVVESKKSFGPRINLLAMDAHVIMRSASAEEYLRVAA